MPSKPFSRPIRPSQRLRRQVALHEAAHVVAAVSRRALVLSVIARADGAGQVFVAADPVHDAFIDFAGVAWEALHEHDIERARVSAKADFDAAQRHAERVGQDLGEVRDAATSFVIERTPVIRAAARFILKHTPGGGGALQDQQIMGLVADVRQRLGMPQMSPRRR